MNNLVDSYPQAGSSLMESLASLLPSSSGKQKKYTAISRKVVEKSAHDNPERYCGWFGVQCCSKKFERRVQEAMDICLRV